MTTPDPLKLARDALAAPEAMAERYRPPGYPMPDAQKQARAAIAAIDDLPASVPSGEPAEPMARFCPGCGSMGDVPSTYRDCCPDGGKARVIPAALAESCRDLFKLALDGVAAQAAPAPADAQEPQR